MIRNRNEFEKRVRSLSTNAVIGLRVLGQGSTKTVRTLSL